MYMKPIVEIDIVKIIDKFSPNQSAGHGKIGNYIITNISKDSSNTDFQSILDNWYYYGQIENSKS